MQPIEDTWTHAHDLTLIFLALGYGADQRLSDREIDAIASALSRWKPNADRSEINEIVLESVAAFLESDPEKEVVQSVKALGHALSLEKRQEALEDIMRIAEADGVLLNAEQNILSVLADAWGVRATKERLLLESIATEEQHPEWSLLHDLALTFVMIAHGGDGTLSGDEIDVIKDRLSGWAPDLSEEKITETLRETLQFYSSDPSAGELSASVRAVKTHLPAAQRLVVLSDLVDIAECDGQMVPDERELIDSLSESWGVDVRMSG
ncbi:MAG: hypothetical protein HKN17_00760 [Rhodothermales bacterium]|nr:hypothetical protein [Rhodothermales bacterium]